MTFFNAPGVKPINEMEENSAKAINRFHSIEYSFLFFLSSVLVPVTPKDGSTTNKRFIEFSSSPPADLVVCSSLFLYHVMILGDRRKKWSYWHFCAKEKRLILHEKGRENGIIISLVNSFERKKRGKKRTQPFSSGKKEKKSSISSFVRIDFCHPDTDRSMKYLAASSPLTNAGDLISTQG